GGDGLTKGYLNLPELTAEKYIIPTFSKERLYRTGDLACYLPDGNLSFLGRIDTQVKIRGFRIELSGVEEVIRQFKNVSDCIALVHQSGDGGKQLVAYITSRPSTKVDEGALREWVASKLPSYMMPSFFVILKKFPMTPNGKVDRKALKPPEGRKDKSFSLKTETEKKVAGVWSRILHLKSIDRNDHFFKIGGDSISAMQTASQLRKIFRCPVTVATLFNHPVLSDLTKELEATQKVTQEGLKRRETLSPVPLSYNQESLWLIDKLSPEQKLLYMIFYAYRIEGAIDLKRLEAALEKIFERHEMLRTYFKEKGGDCFQWIEPSGKNFFRIVDVSDEEEALSLLHESFTAGMDLGQLPLLEVRLFKVKPQLHLMAIRVHHIIFDVLSYENLFREWTTLYSGQSLPELPVQYGDYALWQRKRLKNQAILKQLDFWKSHLSGCQELLELPIDRPRPPTFQGNGKTSSALFSSELSAQLKGLAKDKGVTLYTLLFAIFKVFLYRYSMQEDIIVGTPFANRTRQELDPLIGYFLQVFAVRSDLGGNPEFTTFLLNLNQTLSNCYQNGDIPFEMVVSAINPPRNSSIHPLFQVLFVFENITLSSIQFEKTPLTPIPIEVATAKFDLSLFIFDREEGLECRFEYCTDLFEPETITRMLSNFEALLKSVVKEPEAPIGSLSVIPKTTYHQIVNTWNEVSYDYPQNASIPMLFEDIVKQDPERIALRFDGISTSYGSLNEQGNQIAHFLQKMGIKRGDFVGVYLERSDDLVKVILAILKAGAVYVPIDASYPKERKSYMITHTGLKVLITHRDFAEQFPEKGVKILCLEEEDLSSQTRSNLKGSFSKTDLAYLNFTSGSSGKPKGVEYTQIGIIRLLKEASWLQIGEGDRMLQISNISFDMMAAEVWGALLNGATLCIYPQVEISPHELGQFIVQENISHFYLTARLFVLMVEEGLDYLKKVKFFSSTGDVMSTHHAILARKALPHCRVMNVYGPTETHIATTFLVDSEPTTIPIGRPVAGTPVYILDAQKNPVPIGAFGELYVGGDGVARGYLNNPELTAEKFVQDP
ncbi:MAG: AMP-binding protein, partial [Chlamydiia bacterium]|nr:AMP-binding protein [Chlamydiia bacterium]